MSTPGAACKPVFHTSVAMDQQERDVRALIDANLDDPTATWSLGTFGALAEFRRGADEVASRVSAAGLGIVTRRGAIVIDSAGLLPVAYETAFGRDWSHAVALCLPTACCAMAQRVVLTEIGPDQGAIHTADREASLFDLGLGLLQVDACLRTADPVVLALLRSACGLGPFDPANPIVPRLAELPLTQVFLARPGRIEVYPNAGADAEGPPGPRTFMASQVLRARRTHAATAPIPNGLVPCAYLHPPHPFRDGSGRRTPCRVARHDAFQRLYARWGDPGHIALKARILAGAVSSSGPTDRHMRMVIKVARAQAESMAHGNVPV